MAREGADELRLGAHRRVADPRGDVALLVEDAQQIDEMRLADRIHRLYFVTLG